MPQVGSKVKVPPLLQRGVAEALAALQQEEFDLRRHVLDFHEPLFRSYREDLRRLFLGHFVVKLNPDDPKDKTQVWNPLTQDAEALLAELHDATKDVFETAYEEDEQLFEEELDAFMVEGQERELWLLALAGLPAADYVDQFPDDHGRRNLLLLAGVAGISWRDRLQRWRDEATYKTQRWVQASVVGGRTLDETMDGAGAIATSFNGQVTALLGNEAHRTYQLGGKLAREAVGFNHALAEVWLTRQDGLVCPVCETLHLTVTPLQPIHDTHPACRCMKVPVPIGFTATPISFASFAADLHQARA